MENIHIATAQFEHRSADKQYNLNVIAELSAKASRQGAHVIAFHECSVTGYTFARHLSKEQLLDVAEYIPDGESTRTLISIARDNNIIILAGLFEKDETDSLYKAYVCVDRNGLVAKFESYIHSSTLT